MGSGLCTGVDGGMWSGVEVHGTASARNETVGGVGGVDGGRVGE